jgi:hypothetical protein
MKNNNWKGATVRFRLVKLGVSAALVAMLAMQLGAGSKF